MIEQERRMGEQQQASRFPRPEPNPLSVAIEANRQGFADPRREGRRMFAEALGTFLLTLSATGGQVINAVVGQSAVSRTAEVTAPGLMVLAIILFMGAVSGAHVNPAVTISFAARGDFPWVRVPGYIAAQLVGAALASLLLAGLFGKVGELGATLPAPGITDWQAMALELVLTAGLVSVILGTSSGAQNLGPISAFGIGAYIILAGLWASPISGASMNPARSFGPAVVLWDFDHFWVYIVGPVVGGLVAVGIAWLLRGPGGDLPALMAAQGRLDFREDAEGRAAQRKEPDATTPQGA